MRHVQEREQAGEREREREETMQVSMSMARIIGLIVIAKDPLVDESK